MNETKLINFEITNSKPIKSVLQKQLSPYNTLIDEKSKIEDNRKSESLEKSIDRIASSTSGLIDNTSIANSPQQMLNTSLSHEKLELSSNGEDLKNRMKVSDTEETSSVIITKPSNEDLKGKMIGKENLKNQNSRLLSIDVMNNSAVIDTTDTNTISNEVMSLSSEEENGLINNAFSEISEATLNQSQPPSIISSNINYDLKGYRLSTSALEINRPISPASPVSPVSPVSPTSMIGTPSINHVIIPRCYSALALIEDNNNSSPLRNSVSMYSNYSFSYMNSVIDDIDGESTLAKKKKSVRFSNIVDVIDSNQKDKLANLGNDKDEVFPELSTVINIDDVESTDEDMKTMTSSEDENKSVVMRVEEFFSVVLKYILLTLSSIFCLFYFKKDKKDREKRNGYKSQYAIIKDNSMTNFSTGSEGLSEEDTFSQSSTIGDTNTQDTISPTSLNCLKELNATNVISNPKKKKYNDSAVKPLDQLCIVKNNNDIEFCSLNTKEDYDNSNEQLIVESEVVKRMHLPLMSSLSTSSVNSLSTSGSISSTMASVSYPLTINTLSRQKGERVVRYWYNNNNDTKITTTTTNTNDNGSISSNNSRKKNIYQKLGLSKGSNSDNSKNNKKSKETRIPIDKTVENAKIKRSSIVNYKPTNIDINKIPNINVTTTANTILNSTSNFRNDKKSNSSSNLGKEIIIRDLNSNDKVFYSLNLEKSKIESILNRNPSSNEDGNENEKKEIKTVTIKTPPPSKKASRKFSHRRQNSVRLEVSY
jgi:hypothetical protein